MCLDAQDHPLLKIFEFRVTEQDLVHPANYELMKNYVPNLLSGVKLPNAKLISCKDHRARGSLIVHVLRSPVSEQCVHFSKFLTATEAAVMYLSVVYGFWTEDEMKAKGAKRKLKETTYSCLLESVCWHDARILACRTGANSMGPAFAGL